MQSSKSSSASYSAPKTFESARTPPVCSFGADGSIQTTAITGSTFQQTKLPPKYVGLKSTTGKAIDVAGFQVEAKVVDLASRVQMTQTFVNTTNSSVEAVYSFPINAISAVCAFDANIDGNLITGCVKPKNTAFNKYDDSIAEGNTAALLEKGLIQVFREMTKVEQDTMTTSLGNLPPNSRITITVTYVTELQMEQSNVRFVLPTKRLLDPTTVSGKTIKVSVF